MSALPIRFKAGGAAGSPTENHHHRNTTKSTPKSFKSRYSTKGATKALLKGRMELGQRHTPHQQVMSKLDRRNQARQRQQNKKRDNARASSIFAGRSRASKRVVVVALDESVNALGAVNSLNTGHNVDDDLFMLTSGQMDINIERFKQRLQYAPVNSGSAVVLDACRLADFIIFVLSPKDNIDRTAEQLLVEVEGQGVTNAMFMIQDLSNVQSQKRRVQIISTLKSQISRFFPDVDRIHSLDSSQDCMNAIRYICTNTPRGIRWRDDRSWMSVERVERLSSEDSQQPGQPVADQEQIVVLTGTIRGKGLKADRLIQLGYYGVYKISRITEAVTLTGKAPDRCLATDDSAEERLLDEPSQDQDDVDVLAPFDVVMRDVNEHALAQADVNRKGVLLDDHHYFSDNDVVSDQKPKRVPRGTSSYQAAWYLDDATDSSSESDEEDEDGDYVMNKLEISAASTIPDDTHTRASGVDGPLSTVAPSEMFLDPSPDQEMDQLIAFRARQRDEAKEDAEFPDEIELTPQTVARERLERYRGLKSIRTSPWEVDEDKGHELEDWDRLLRIRNYKGTKNRVFREALVGGAAAGTKVHVHVRNVPISLASHDFTHSPLGLYSLLRHENKHTVINVSISLDTSYPHPIKSKDELIMQCGPRRFIISPLFSQGGQTPNNVHKYDRHLHPGRTAIATFIGPVTWGSVPILFFKRHPAADSGDTSLQLIGRGTCLPPDIDRVVAKRIVLTGHPYKIHRNLVTVRYMFFNADDVNWFKALPLWTKRGRSGFIKDSLGTHGYFKATFDGRINPQDAICVSLYKRVFPKVATPWMPII